MPDMIRDGKGSGRLVEVNAENQLKTRSVIMEEAVHMAESHGYYFAAASGVNITNSTNEHSLLYIKNLDTKNKMFVRCILPGWNGGDTNHNRSCRIRVYKNPSAPTLNHSELVPGNLNWASPNLSLTSSYKWDGTASDGMTVADKGALIYDNLLGQGLTVLDVIGVPILGYNNSILLSLTPEEVGRISMVVRFYFKELV